VLKDPSDKTQKGFPVNSGRVRGTKILCNQTLLICINLSQKITFEILRPGLLVPGIIICVSDYAHGLSTKCPKFSQDESTQLRAKTASASLLNISFFSYWKKIIRSRHKKLQRWKEPMDQHLQWFIPAPHYFQNLA